MASIKNSDDDEDDDDFGDMMICLCASSHNLCHRNMSVLLFASFSCRLLQATFHYTGKYSSYL